MRVLDDAWERADLPRGTAVTIGNYDGVHRGQRAVLERTTRHAAENGLTSVVVTFDPHPLLVLDPERAPRRLSTPAQKERLLGECGVDCLAVLRFDRDLARVAAPEFVRRLLVDSLAARRVFVGSRFAFGRAREGDLALLEALGPELGFEATGVPEVLHDGRPISSTRIRQEVAAGRVEEACELLGRPYALAGTVVHGDGRGRQLGWPTANLDLDNELPPANGVYAAGLRIEGAERPLPGVANLGVRPTVGGRERFVEIHLFDFDGDLYDRETELVLCRRLRDERRFPSLEALSAQIAADARRAREYFAAGSCWQKGTSPGA